jgi:hypothetical protein
LVQQFVSAVRGHFSCSAVEIAAVAEWNESGSFACNRSGNRLSKAARCLQAEAAIDLSGLWSDDGPLNGNPGKALACG